MFFQTRQEEPVASVVPVNKSSFNPDDVKSKPMPGQLAHGLAYRGYDPTIGPLKSLVFDVDYNWNKEVTNTPRAAVFEAHRLEERYCVASAGDNLPNLNVRLIEGPHFYQPILVSRFLSRDDFLVSTPNSYDFMFSKQDNIFLLEFYSPFLKTFGCSQMRPYKSYTGDYHFCFLR